MAIELNSYPTLLNDANLLAYYRFESDLVDSKSALNGTNGGVTYSAGMFGNAGVFNGSSYFTLPTSTSFDLTSGTWNFWIKLNSATASDTVIFDHWDETTGSGNYAGFSISHFTDGVNKFRTQVVISNGTGGNITTNTVDHGTSDTSYHLLTVTLTGTTSKIYFDGTLVSTKTDHSSVNYSTNPTIHVGCRYREFTSGRDLYLNGQIDDMSIFSRVLTATEISDYSGTSNPIVGTIKALVVGGGGGGGSGAGGGGGGGGLVYDAALSVSAIAYAVTVGSGGAGGASASLPGSNGVSSSFYSLTGTGGGGGGSNLNAPGINGGCGGGNSGTGGANSTVGVGSQGFNGGVHSQSASAYGSGGGGGMGAVGANGTSIAGGNGGAGLANSISGASVTYAGGGGGSTYSGNGTAGTGGSGGGGNASVSGAGSNGTANTGGGGGGSASDSGGNAVGLGGTGGSGIVIISYATDGSDGVSTSSTGGTITTSGDQTIHTFTSSGTFTLVASATNNSGFFLFF